jgi:hypothetical protein
VLDSNALIGRVISDQCIIEKPDVGDIGVVYKAGDAHLNHFVALKFVPEDLARDRQGLVKLLVTVQSVKVLPLGGYHAK